MHSRLNGVIVDRVLRPRSISEVQNIVRRARREGRAVITAGGRHAMGGQQFGADAILIDMGAMDRVIGFDVETGLVEAEAGIQWPGLMSALLERQEGRWPQWGIRQKQTGADRLSLGGALSSNIHGRGLQLKPFIADVESFSLVGPDGERRRCSRRENADLFKLAIGGYGLFGVIVDVKLRLARRRKLERVVEIADVNDLAGVFQERIDGGFLYGDFQFSTDMESRDFMKRGVFSCYRPVSDETPIPATQAELSEQDWRELYALAHADKMRAFKTYSDFYLSTSGQIYWSDLHQSSVYIDHYHRDLDVRLGRKDPASEMITEVFVPRNELAGFLEEQREDFRRNGTPLIYGTVRLIERDDESFLAWARERCACIIFNICVAHSAAGVEEASRTFRRIIDAAIGRGGSFYLTYHRWATRRQVEAGHPKFGEFLRLKKRHDPGERFQSEWYRHYKALFST